MSDEIDHGLIPDDLAWNLALDEATQVVGPFQVIHARGEISGGPRAVARTSQLGNLKVRTRRAVAPIRAFSTHATSCIDMKSPATARKRSPFAAGCVIARR